MTISELGRYSARWGSDFVLVQGAGGNTSVKQDGVLRVKASGFRLADALDRDIFVDMPLAAGLAMADGGPSYSDSTGRRASIETSLHAVMPQRVVAHLHMIPLIAIAVRADAEAVLAERLAGIEWAMVSYLRPGVAVAQAVRTIIEERGAPGVIVLANHGIVFAGEDFEAVDALVEHVRGLLEVPEAELPEPDLVALAATGERLGLEPARFADAHRAALDSKAIAVATAGSLYPDHVVFLGRGAATIDAAGRGDAETHLFLAPGQGALLNPGLGDEAHEMAACLAGVATRVPAGAPLSVLGREAEDALINWDAEIYRRSLAAGATS